MFEKESKEYANKWLEHVKDLGLQHKSDEKPEYIRILEAHQKGAEFGYNKKTETSQKIINQFFVFLVILIQIIVKLVIIMMLEVKSLGILKLIIYQMMTVIMLRELSLGKKLYFRRRVNK